MMQQTNSRRLSWDEADRFAELVAAHWQREHHNPTDTEINTMIDTAREMAAVNAVLQ